MNSPRRRASRLLAIAFALGLCAPALGCAPLQTLVTSPDDYAAYRATRVAPTFDDRLAAAFLYLERFPTGSYAPEVRAYFDEAEPIFYAAKTGSVPGLEAYLRALPRGPRSDSVLAELRARRAARDSQDDLRGVTAIGARLTALTAQRARVRTEIEAWIRRFLDPQAWARPMVDAPADLIVAWSLGLPAPVCGVPEDATPDRARRCAKILELPYTVTADGQPEEHQATIEIAVIQDAAGRPIEVTIGGPALFLRLEETFSARSIAEDDTARKASATSRVVDLVRREFQERVDASPACRRPPAGSIFLHLACKETRVTVRAPATPVEDDAISISRTAPRP